MSDMRIVSGGDLATRVSGGDWRTHNPATHRATGYVSTGTGSTLPELVERVDIPPPAVGGKALRWYQCTSQEEAMSRG